MYWIDKVLIVFPLAVLVIVSLYARRYAGSVADFLSASRSARRYLLCIAGEETISGAVTFVAAFEVFAHSGFVLSWWSSISALSLFLFKISGFVTYRYRETRAMTLAQFFEIRYNKSFRLFTGLLGFTAGMLNFGIIPGVGARAMVYFLNLPTTTHLMSWTLPTYVPLMALLQVLTLVVTLSSGIITVMVINAMEGIFTQILYVVIIFYIIATFSWPEIKTVLMAQPPGHSLINPFESSGVKDFNIWFILMSIFISAYSTMAWQNTSGINSAGLTPHENRMGNVLGGWRAMSKNAATVLLCLAAMTFLHHPHFAAGAAHAQSLDARISNPQEREQMEIPIAIATLMPPGIKGAFCAILLMGIFAGCASHMHSWGSMMVQDCYVPLQKKPLGLHTHLLILRCSIIGVAIFSFLFSTFFHLSDYITMWFSITTAVYTGGAGSAIIGGLYWKKGTAAGAWASFITGSGLSLLGILVQQSFASHNLKFFLNGIQISFFSSLLAIIVYIVTSLLTHREDFNLERMLHRGTYAKKTDPDTDPSAPVVASTGLGKFIGVDHHFSRSDKWIAIGLVCWAFFWLVMFVIGTIWNLLSRWPDEAWASYYHVVGFGIPILMSVVTCIWFTWGGLSDLLDLFKRLRTKKINERDDGTVVNHQNLDDLPSH